MHMLSATAYPASGRFSRRSKPAGSQTIQAESTLMISASYLNGIQMSLACTVARTSAAVTAKGPANQQ